MKPPPKSKHGIAHSNNPEVVRQQIKGALESITIREAQRIVAELKAKGLITFRRPLTPTEVAQAQAAVNAERWRERNGVKSNKVSACGKTRVKHGRNE